MHLDRTSDRALLRESYREGKSVKKRTIANLSACSKRELDAIELALQHKDKLEDLLATINLKQEIIQGPSFGAVFVINEIAKELGIVDALGNSRDGRLALWQVIARVIDQGSRLSAVRLAKSHTTCELLKLDSFNEDDLYRNLNWLHKNQTTIEDKLFSKQKTEKENSSLFLYDVTSSYFEGECNELAAFGYNRDGKKGKRQIVIGLLCNSNGDPVSIEVFPGNTQDPKTVSSQLRKLTERFKAKAITFVGDRGMIKSEQKKEILSLVPGQSHYITAITKPQIKKLIKDGTLQMSLFDTKLAEITITVDSKDDLEATGEPEEKEEEKETKERICRYIMRKNPIREKEIKTVRAEKLQVIEQAVIKQNEYLQNHPMATVDVALKRLLIKAQNLKIDHLIKYSIDKESKTIQIQIDEEALADDSKLDGCYVIETDIPSQDIDKEIIHTRYKDLARVETAFRKSKTVDLELRPIYLRAEERTRAHALVVMLAYMILKELEFRWVNIEKTSLEAIQELTTLCVYRTNILTTMYQIPKPRESIETLLEAAKIKLPQIIKKSDVIVDTRKKLTSERKNQLFSALT